MVRSYYIVWTLVTKGVNEYPLFTTCALIEGRYFRIDDLGAYFLKSGGITEEEIFPNGFLLINSADWQNQLTFNLRNR